MEKIVIFIRSVNSVITELLRLEQRNLPAFKCAA